MGTPHAADSSATPRLRLSLPYVSRSPYARRILTFSAGVLFGPLLICFAMQGLLMPPATGPSAAVNVNDFSRWTPPNGQPHRGGGRLAPPYMVEAW
eukprot:12750-Prymnesium_polylepis.1